MTVPETVVAELPVVDGMILDADVASDGIIIVVSLVLQRLDRRLQNSFLFYKHCHSIVHICELLL